MRHRSSSGIPSVCTCLLVAIAGGLGGWLAGCSDDETTAPASEPLALEATEPSYALVDSVDLALTLHGAGFVPGARAGWNGSPRITSYISSTKLVVTVPASDLSSSGDIDLRVVQGDSDDVSNAIVFPIRHGVGVPTLESIVPPWLYVTTETRELQLIGSGFEPSSIVLWDDTPRTTTFFSPNEVVVTLEENDLNAESSVELRLETPGDLGGVSEPVLIQILPEPANPVVVQVRPASLFVGTTSPTVSVLGYGFSEEAVVWWTDHALSTEFVSATELRAIVPDADLLEPIEAEITVHLSGVVSDPTRVEVRNPVAPNLDSVDPTFVDIGGSHTTLVVTGTEFTEETEFLLEGVPQQTTFISAQRINVELSLEVLETPGIDTVVLRTRDLSSATPLQIIRYRELDWPGNDLAFDTERGLIYVAVPGDHPVGNHIVAVDPATGAEEFAIFVGSEPRQLVPSADGGYLYVALEGVPRIVRINLDSREVDLDFDLGRNGDIPYFPLDLAVSPLDPDLIAVAIEHPARTPAYNGTALYRNGVQVDYWYERRPEVHFLEFAPDGASVYGASIGDETIALLSVTDDRLALKGSEPSLDGRQVYGIEIADGRLYGSLGEVLDANDLSRIGTCGQGGFALPEPDQGRIIYLTSTAQAPRLSAYDAKSFELLDETPLPWNDVRDFRRDFGSLVGLGNGNVAFLGEGRAYLFPTAGWSQ